MAPVLEKAECFGDTAKECSHFKSARALLKRGIWIGYLNEFNRGFEGLPSYSELKKRYSNFVAPFPEDCDLEGEPGNVRYALCSGCQTGTDDDQLIKIIELQLAKKKKVSVLPLIDEDGEMLFCILKGKSVERRFMRYSFWQSSGDVSENISLFGTTEVGQRYGTLSAIRAYHGNGRHLGQGSQHGVTPSRRPPKHTVEATSAPQTGTPSKRQRTTGTASRAKTPTINGNVGPGVDEPSISTLEADAQGLEQLMSTITSPRTDAEEEGTSPREKRAMLRRRTSTATRTATPKKSSKAPITPAHRSIRTISPAIADEDGAASSPGSSELLGDELLPAQARRVRFVWTYEADGREGQIVLCLADHCTAKQLFKGLETEADAEQSTKRIFKNAKFWYLDRREPDGRIKGIRMSSKNGVTSESSFRYLREQIALSEHWEIGQGDYHIDLKPGS